MSVVFYLKYIIGRSVFLSGGNEERNNGALDVVDFPFSRHLKILNHTSQI